VTDQEAKPKRRLAAIMATDIVGYSKLMQSDETTALEALSGVRNATQEQIQRHQGRIANTAGDSVLAEFGSAVEAVDCAIALQQQLSSRTQGEDLKVRIGIHLGDVVDKAGDLFGTAVNIAARLEGIAQPGGIVVSAAVRDAISRKVAASFTDLGLQALKNIEEPHRAFALAPKAGPLSSGVLRTGEVLLLPSKPSIAVLPFENLSNDPSQQYFSDGVTEDIITELSRFHNLFVRARNASFRFRNKAIDVQQVGRELNVQYVVEGSVRRLGNRFRITAQLIDTASCNHVWAEHYDVDQEEIFAVQDHLVRSLVGTLAGRLEAAGTEQSMRKPPASLMAYDCVLRGNALTVGELRADAEARRLYERAIELDPTYGAAYVELSYALINEWFQEMTDSAAALDRALEMAKRAVQLDDTNSASNQHLGWVYLVRRAYDLAEYYLQRALALNPNSPVSLVGIADWLTYVGRADEASEWLKKARLLDPHYNPHWWWRTVGLAHFNESKYDEAIADFSRSPILHAWVHAYIAASHALAQRTESARESVAEVLRLKPALSIAHLVAKEPYKRLADQEHLIGGLRKAGLPE
jgi:adenylate cyclase